MSVSLISNKFLANLAFAPSGLVHRIIAIEAADR